MPLRFRVELTKNKPRIAVLRVQKQEKGQETLELVGAFGQRKSPEALKAKLTEDELYEFENALSHLEFAENVCDTEAHELNRMMIKVAPRFQAALFQLWQEAKRLDMEFIPEKEMLYGVLQKAKAMEQKVNQLSKQSLNLFGEFDQSLGPDNTSLSSDIESKKLFQALLNLNRPLEDIAQEFQDISHTLYHKKTRFEPHFFLIYADPANTKSFPKWYYTVAIELLLRYQVNPIHVVPAPLVARHWARMKSQSMSLSQAKQQFISTFQPLESDMPSCMVMINEAYLSETTPTVETSSDVLNR